MHNDNIVNGKNHADLKGQSGDQPKTKRSALTDWDVLRRSRLKLPAELTGLSREDAQTALAAYLVQGLDAPENKRIRAVFDVEADGIAERAGADVMSALAGSMLPKRKVTVDNLLAHPEWALAIGRFGDAEQIQRLKDIDADLYRSGCKGGRRLGWLIDAAFILSGQMEAASRKGGKLRTGWLFQHIFDSPYRSCIPDGALIGPDGCGSVPTSEGPMALSMSPEFRLRYTDPTNGRKTGSVPGWLSVKPEDRRQRKALAAMQHYLTALRRELQDLLESMYLLGETLPGQWLTRIAADPLLARYFRYVVFRQADTDFMLMPSGFITADGNTHTPHQFRLVSVPHPLEMDDETLAAFRAVPKRGYAKVSQLREPVYDTENLPDALKTGTWEACVHTDNGESVLEVTSNRFVPHGIRDACKQYRTNHMGLYYQQWYRFPVSAGDRIVNHILCRLDKDTMESRMKQDDISLLPLLRINNPKHALQNAIKAKATAITAALLEEVNGAQAPRGASDFRI